MSDNISYRINEIRVDLNEDKAIIPDKIRRRTGIRNLEIYSWKIARESIDARRRLAFLSVSASLPTSDSSMPNI